MGSPSLSFTEAAGSDLRAIVSIRRLSYLRGTVTRLRTSDLNGMLAFLEEANSVDGPEPIPRTLLASLRRLVPSDMVTYCELDRVRQVGIWSEDDPYVESDGSELETYRRLRHQHPACHYEDETGDFRATKISDFVSKAELRRREIYWEWFRPYGIEHELGVGIDAPLSHTKVFVFDRMGGRDFSERDRDVSGRRCGLTLRSSMRQRIYAAPRVRPSLSSSERKRPWSSSRARARSPTRRRQRGACWRSTFERAEARDPHEIADWLREQRRVPNPGPLTVERGEGSVVVQLVDGSLLLEEQRESPRLTERESEILDLVAAGKTNAEIAEALWIAPGTVRKHLENVSEAGSPQPDGGSGKAPAQLEPSALWFRAESGPIAVVARSRWPSTRFWISSPHLPGRTR